ncbi:MAG TPA: DinB family protein [Blastocatellia bacterium]|nr:DinB family protein [Blastocatellia bacterium]
MGESNALTAALLSKLEEQIELTVGLITLIPPEKLEYKPLPDSLRVCDLLGHLLECLAGFCASLYAVKPDSLAHFESLRGLEVNHCCGIEEARNRISDYASHIREGFSLLTDDDLVRRVQTIFVPEGEALMTVLLGNLEHLINHKHQLFFYLKLLGVPVATRDLYRIRELAD